MTDEQMPAVGIKNITKRFGDVVAVNNINLDIGDGEFFAVLGPSGCGKTTTLRMIAGLELPTEGSLKIFGDEVGTLPPNKRPVNTVFQAYALFPHMTVADNVGFGLKMQKVPKDEIVQRVKDAIGLVQLGGMEGRRPSQLSGGQQQRVALARALVNRPKVLLLDEPLGALDLKLRQEMQVELKTLQRDVGITFVFVTHDQEEALTMSDRIAVMHNGDLLQVGSPQEIYEQPSSRFVADFIGRTNLLEATIEDADSVRMGDGSLLALSALAAPGTSRPPKGAKVAVSIRPERARLHPKDGGSPPGPALGGRLKNTTYLGSALVHTIDLGWATVEVKTANHPDDGVRVGDEVVVSWEPDSAAIVVD